MRYDRSVRKQLRNLTKMYAIDPNLAQRVGLPTDSMDSLYLENLVAVELWRRGSRVYYWDNPEGEVDFVVESPTEGRSLVQVAWSLEDPRTFERKIAEFTHFEKAFPRLRIDKKLIVNVEYHLERAIPDTISVMPFQQWALE